MRYTKTHLGAILILFFWVGEQIYAKKSQVGGKAFLTL